jgi:hypothetical protein
MSWPTQCKTRCSAVLASFDRQYEALIAKYSGAKMEMGLVQTALVETGKLVQKSSSLNENDVICKQVTDRADAEKSTFCKHLDGKALFTGMLHLYAMIQ